MEKICKQCGNNFIVNEKLKRDREKIFCGITCSRKNNGLKNKGRKATDETKKLMSDKKIGDKNPFFGKTHSTELQLQITNNKLKTNLKNAKNCNLSDIEYEILDGIMISDGCLTSISGISGRLTLGFKYNETLEDIKLALPSISFGPTFISENNNSFHNKSKMYADLLIENKRWYFEGKKSVPDDIRITAISSYWWYIGDGYNSRGNVFLCTDSFTKEENLVLIIKLNELGFKCKLTSKNRIRFYKKDSIEFLNWITPENGIHKQYKYKWKI